MASIPDTQHAVALYLPPFPRPADHVDTLTGDLLAVQRYAEQLIAKQRSATEWPLPPAIMAQLADRGVLTATGTVCAEALVAFEDLHRAQMEAVLRQNIDALRETLSAAGFLDE